MRRAVFSIALTALLVAPAAAERDTVWYVPGDFDTLQEAIDDASVLDGDTIRLRKGSQEGANLDKALCIEGQGGAVIDSGPLHKGGPLNVGIALFAGSEGTVIQHLTFDGVDLAIMNRDAVDDVVVTDCTFLDTIQGVSNWRGSGWSITHNKFEDLRTCNGGGIAILIGDYMGGVVEDNVVSYNDIRGAITSCATEQGGYSATGIVLYADFRWSRDGSKGIRDNTVTHNRIALTSDSLYVPVVAIELTDTLDDETLDAVIFDNAVGFNDMRKSDAQLALTPANLDEHNTISRNLGNNRGHGAHPSALGAGN